MMQSDEILNLRHKRLASKLKSENKWAVILVPGPAFRYYSNADFYLMERITLLSIDQNAKVHAVVPFIERTQWEKLMPFANTYYWRDEEGPIKALQQFATELKGETLIEGLRMRAGELEMLKNAAKEQIFSDGQDLISTMRIEKEPNEIDTIRKAIKISEIALEQTLLEIGAGISEAELKAKLIQNLFRFGADGVAFEPIVLFGPNSADCHGRSSHNKILEPGETILIDFGGSYQGYHADITRTFFAQHVSEKHARLYENVLKANALGREMINHQVTAAALDQAVTSCLKQGEFSEFIKHKTGHGLGLDVHELPQISITNETALRPGMVFTIEPGLYIDGEIGVRIEDDVALTNGAPDCLTSFSRDLRIIELK